MSDKDDVEVTKKSNNRVEGLKWAVLMILGFAIGYGLSLIF